MDAESEKQIWASEIWKVQSVYILDLDKQLINVNEVEKYPYYFTQI
jgi:hypothetical protein